MEPIEKDPGEWISNLDERRIQMNKFDLKCSKTGKDFIIHILNNLPKEYYLIIKGLENHLIASGDGALNIEVICKKINHRYKNIKKKNKDKSEKEKALGAYLLSYLWYLIGY